MTQPRSQLAQGVWSDGLAALEQIEDAAKRARLLLDYSTDGPDADAMQAFVGWAESVAPVARAAAAALLNGAPPDAGEEGDGDNDSRDSGGGNLDAGAGERREPDARRADESAQLDGQPEHNDAAERGEARGGDGARKAG